MPRSTTLTRNDYLRHAKAGAIRKATITEISNGLAVWYDFCRGKAFRTAFVIIP